MLLSLAKMQDPELFHAGRDSFVKHITGFGLGMFLGEKMTLDFGETKVKHFIDDPNKDFHFRTIDAKEEKTRRIFKKISRTMETTRSQIVAETNNFSVTNISFSSGESQLNEPAKKFLTQFSINLQQDTGPGEVKLYVLGLARDEQTEKKQWILSAMRAQAVADFLKRLLPSHLQCPVYSWGAGPGGRWITRDSPASKQSQILIAVLRAND
jgi:outer membrane protein OmpA-like peptidoglycan-associated protein